MIYDIFPVNNYQGNGSSTVFDFDFYIDNASQLKVYLFDSDGAKYLLEHEIDYSLEGEQNPNGGYITFPLEDSNYSILSEGQKLSLELDIPVSQETQYNNSSLLNLGTLEYSFDYLTRLIQILKRKLSLCVKVEECSNNTPEELIKLINDAHVSTSLDAKEANSQKLSAQVAAQNAQKYLKLTEEISNDIATFYDEFRSNGMYKFNLFDTKISDHILEGNEAKGWALQGTYVSGALYPDFYGKCLEEKNNATATKATLADSALTMFVNSNGHQFYNIADKSIVDTFYNIYGIADFYGIDEENERIFLPRNKYFHQLTDEPLKVNEIVEAGLPQIISGKLIDYVGTGGSGALATGSSAKAITPNPIYGKSDTVQPPSSLKLLYYCVGNTVINDAEIDAGGLVAQMEQKANTSLDNITSVAKATMANMAMPSDEYIDLTLGATGTTYTAPANGYFYFEKGAGKTSLVYVQLKNITNGMCSEYASSGSSTNYAKAFLPVKKGDTVRVSYDASGSTGACRFIYAEGEQ